MNIYKISCLSECGTYFMPYLKSITVLADDKDTAIKTAKLWMKNNSEEFLYNEASWTVTLKKSNIKNNCVVDYSIESDH